MELSLLELRKEAQALGIENYAKYSKAELIEIVAAKKAGVTVAQDDSMIASEEEAQDIEKMEAAGEVENITAEEAEELTPAGKKKLTPEEKLAERKAKKEAEKAAKEAEKAEKKRLKEEVKAAKKAEKKAAKPGRAPVVTVKLIPNGEKPTFKAETSSKIYDELLKNDGRSYGTIARDLGSHYNMVRRIAEMNFHPETPEACQQDEQDSAADEAAE